MFCPNCGKQVPEGAHFCTSCGFRLVSENRIPVQEVIRNVLRRRIEGIKNRDAKAIEGTVYKERYTKFDDWPPFDLQDSEGLRNEAQALKVLREYDYETKTWNIEVFEDSALATFTIRYWGRIRDLSFNVQSRVTAFLMKHEGEWRIVHEHWSRFPQQQLASKASSEAKSPFSSL